VSLSNITWLRGMFPEDVYADKTLGGIKIKTLREKTDNEEAKTLAKWLIGAFDAIEKNYLREMIFFIYLDEHKPEEVFEKYTFSFRYEDGQAAFQMTKEDQVKKPVEMTNIRETTKILIRNIVATTSTLEPLPKTAFVAIKLSYYDEVTPMDYEPEGFAASTLEEAPMASSVSLGGVTTNHHALRLSVATSLVKEGGLVNNNYACESQSQSQSQVKEADVGGISCVCGNTTPDPLMLTCAGCSKAQHGACYRILSPEDVPAKHWCVQCADDSRPCTDPKLMKMIAKDPSSTANTCLYRRVLVSLGKLDSTTKEGLMGPLNLNGFDADKFMKKLVNDDVLEEKDDGVLLVSQSSLQSAMKRFIGIKIQDKALSNIVSRTVEMALNGRGDGKTGVKRSLEFSASEEKQDGAGASHSLTKIKRSKSKGALLC